MSEPIHQTQTPPSATSSDQVILPRSEEAAAQPVSDPNAKAAKEAQDRMAKTQGFWNKIAPAKESDKPANPADAKSDKGKPAEAATSATTKPDQKTGDKLARRRREPEIDPIQIAEATGQAIGREMAKAAQPVVAPRGTTTQEPTDEVELPEEFRADVAVFEEMSRLDPKRYGNIKKDLAKYAQAETDYIAKWEKEHEGETFDGDSDEHDAFYAKIRPNYDQKDFKSAERSLLKNSVRDEVKKEMSEEIRNREVESEKRRERAAQIEPEVARDMFSTLADMITTIDPENAELAKNWESMQTIDEKNPMLSDAMRLVHDETRPVVNAAVRLFRGVEQFNAQTPEHRKVSEAIYTAEQKISQLPIKDRYNDDGQLFATQEQYMKMTPAEQQRHWFIGERELVAILRGQAVSRTKSIYEQKKQEIERYTKRQSSTQTTNHQSVNNGAKPAQEKADNSSPTVGGRGTLPGDSQTGNAAPKSGRDSFFSRMIGA